MVSTQTIFWRSILISIAIFGAGLLFGLYLDNLRSDEVYDELRTNELSTESYLVEQTFWDTFEMNDCELAEKRLNSISTELAELGMYLNSYEKKSLFKDQEFEYLAHRYFLLEIKGYILYNQLKDNCNLQNDVILYFYSPEDSSSEMQGYVLDRLVQKSNNTIDIFSINKDFEGDPAIESLMIYYNVTISPTLVINEKIKEGYTSYAELQELIDTT
jgi:hypothetical protein